MTFGVVDGGRPVFGRGDLIASLVLIVPLFLAYQVGVLFAGSVNGADIVTRALYGALGRTNYLLASAVAGLAFLLWLRRAGRWSMLRVEIVGPVLLEAAVYALTLGALISLVLERALGLGLGLGSMIDAAGAGVHEELVFRLALFGGLLVLMQRLEIDRRVGLAFALVVSAIVFSWAHHVGAHGEPFTMHAFAYRSLAGVVFGLVCYFRSLAHAVYAHAFYDMLVYWRA
jgi:hypothetical protein